MAITAGIAGWCVRAEKSGIGALREFSRTLRCSGSLSGEMKCQSEQFC
ncbi:fatty acid desaturase [Azoarcus sp. CIB]|nr:fatty acid desaturase [Azoarcus sp. CIB]